MVYNPEGFDAAGGYAVTVTMAARWLSHGEEHAAGGRTDREKSLVHGPSPAQRILTWTGDVLRLVATRLTAPSGHTSDRPPRPAGGTPLVGTGWRRVKIDWMRAAPGPVAATQLRQHGAEDSR